MLNPSKAANGPVLPMDMKVIKSDLEKTISTQGPNENIFDWIDVSKLFQLHTLNILCTILFIL